MPIDRIIPRRFITVPPGTRQHMVDGVHHGTSMSDAPRGIQVRRETTIVYVTERALCRSEPTTSERWPRASPLIGHTSNYCAGRAFATAEELRHPMLEWPPVQRALAAGESRLPLAEPSPASVDAEAGGRTTTNPVSQQSGAVQPPAPGYGAGIQARPKFLALPEFTSWISLPSARLALRSTVPSQSAQYSRPAVTSMAIPCTVVWLVTRG